MVLNPPRKGIKAAALEAVLAAGAPRDYLCFLRARAAWRAISTGLVAANYRVEQIQPFDMFPQTEEVETLVLLRKNDATANQSLHGYEDAASESKSR